MKVVPRNGAVLCKMVNEAEREDSSSGFVYRKRELPVYGVIASDGSNGLCLVEGDLIVCNSTGTKLKLGDGSVQYLFSKENVVGKVSER